MIFFVESEGVDVELAVLGSTYVLAGGSAELLEGTLAGGLEDEVAEAV